MVAFVKVAFVKVAFVMVTHKEPNKTRTNQNLLFRSQGYQPIRDQYFLIRSVPGYRSDHYILEGVGHEFRGEEHEGGNLKKLCDIPQNQEDEGCVAK
eukprot:sb/3478992/